MSGFLQALPVTLGFEGGYVVDQGGPTYQGVTQKAYDKYRTKHGHPKRDVREIAESERDHLYYEGYWIAARCDALPWPLSMVHFDHAVNAGPARAITSLQIAIDAEPDGRWGPETKKRLGLESHDLNGLMERMLWARVEHYHRLAFNHPTAYRDDLTGWLGRVIRLRKKALELW